MSTQNTSNDAKKAGGYLKEKFTIGMTRINNDEVTRAVMKVTSHKLKSPNEKHMVRLISASYGNVREESSKKHSNINEYIVSEIEKRSHAHNWIVVLKSMVVFHRLMHDGSPEINTVIQKNRNIFCLRHFKDVADTPDGAAQKYFLESYIRYLEERNYSHRQIGVHSRLESPEFAQMVKSLELPQLLPIFEALQLQLEMLVEIEYREVAVDNFCTLEAYRKVILDGRRLHAILYDRARVIVDRFDDLVIDEKKAWYKLYEKYHTSLEKLVVLFSALGSANRHFGEDVPVIRALPITILHHLRDELKYSSIPKESISNVLNNVAPAKKGLSPPIANVSTTPSANLGHTLASTMPDIFGDDDISMPSNHHHHHHHATIATSSGPSFTPSGNVSSIATPTAPSAPSAITSAQPIDLFGQWNGIDSASSSATGSSAFPSASSSPLPPQAPGAPRFGTPPRVGAISTPTTAKNAGGPTADPFQSLFGATATTSSDPPKPPTETIRKPPVEFDPFAEEVPAQPNDEGQECDAGPVDFFSTSRRSSHQNTSTSPGSRQQPGYSSDGRHKAW